MSNDLQMLCVTQHKGAAFQYAFTAVSALFYMSDMYVFVAVGKFADARSKHNEVRCSYILETSIP